MGNVLSLLLDYTINMNVSILQNDHRIQNVGILLGGYLTVKNEWGFLTGYDVGSHPVKKPSNHIQNCPSTTDE